MQFHVTRTLELLEDHLIHLRTRIDECCCDDGERTATLDVTGCTEETLRLLQGIGIDTTGENLSASGCNGVVCAGQTSDTVEEDHNVVSTFHHALGFLKHDAGNLYVALGRLVEG